MKVGNSKFTVIRAYAARRLRLPRHAFITLLLFYLPTSLPPCVPPLAAAGAKSGSGIVVSDDIIGASGGNISMSQDIYSAQGFIGNLASSSQTFDTSSVESGFYSILASTPSFFDYNSVSTGSFNLNWQNIYNPDYVLYTLHISTVSDIYSYLLEDSSYGLGKNFSGLTPNTTYYSRIYSNAMESDYSALVSTTLVTLSESVSSTTFLFKDAGPVSADLEFLSPGNPPPDQTASWAGHSLLPAFLYGHDTVVYSSRVYLSGGFDGVDFSSAVYSATIDGAGNLGSWTNAGYLPMKLYGHRTVSAKGRIYVIGGYDGDRPRNEVWSANISTDATLGDWTGESSLLSNSYLHDATVSGDYIYVTGGFDGNAALSSVLRGHIEANGEILSWQNDSGLNEPVFAHSVVQISTHLVLLGGNNGSGAVPSVWGADIKDDGTLTAWVAGKPMPAGLYSHTAGIMATRIFVVGGNDNAAAGNSVFYCDISSGGVFSDWTLYNPLNTERQFHSSVMNGGRIYLFGGNDGSFASNLVISADFLGTEYKAQAGDTPSFTVPLEESRWVSGFSWNFSSLTPNTTYYFKATSKNRAGVVNDFSETASTVTLAAMPARSDWTDVQVSTITANWLANQNPDGTEYVCEISSLTDYSNSFASQTYLTSASFYGLLPSTTYYGRVKAVDRLNRNTRFTVLGSTKTFFDPALDTSSPTIDNNQPGDIVWRSTNGGVYNINFADTGGSELKEIRIKAYTGPGETGTLLADWTAVLTSINSSSYSDLWPLTSDLWNLLAPGTNYVSVKAVDNVDLSSEAIDAFYILKDTDAPGISVSYAPSSDWFADYPGAVSSATFSDPLSRLKQIRYSVSANQFSADASIIGWTDISDPSGYDILESTWNYNFSQLANSSTNYFSLKAVDAAGNEYTMTDAFKILKNVSGPVVSISTPSRLFLSTLTAVSGYNTETDGKAVEATELSLKDKTSNLYWNGSSFISASRYWHVAADTNPYTLTLAGLSLVEGRQYELVARSSDSAGNYSQLFATASFTYDTVPPETKIYFPQDGSKSYSPAYINGTAQDALNSVSAIQLSIRRSSDGGYWNPASSQWEVSRSSINVTPSSDWTWNFSEILKASLPNGDTCYASVRSADASDPENWSEFDLSGSTFVYYDITPPGTPGIISAARGELPGTLGVYWTTPGDDGAGGFFLDGSFLVQHSTYPEAVFSTVTPSVVLSTSDLSAGSTQYWEFSGFLPDTTYYFKIWARDDALNYSPVSGLLSERTSSAAPGFINGTVMQSSSEPIQGVIVEAWGGDNLLKAGDATNSFGEYDISGLEPGIYTVKALWSAEDIISWVSKSDISAGSPGVNFLLKVSYQLASISGYIPLSGALSARNRLSALSSPAGKPRVEIYQRGRLVAGTDLDENGNFTITNLLPGSYSVRAYNGGEYSSSSEIRLSEGQRFIFRPAWNILNENKVYAYPNPSKNSASVYFETGLPDFDAELAFFDVSGKLVKKFGRDDVAAEGGGWKITWNHSADNAASGVYIYVLKLKDPATGEKKKTIKKMAIIR